MWSLTLLQICFLIFKTSYRNARLESLVCAGNAFPAQKFLARFPSAQNSLIDQFLRRFSDQFAALPAQFSKKGLQILLLPRMEQFQYNPCSSDLCMDGLMKQEQE